MTHAQSPVDSNHATKKTAFGSSRRDVSGKLLKGSAP